MSDETDDKNTDTSKPKPKRTLKPQITIPLTMGDVKMALGCLDGLPDNDRESCRNSGGGNPKELTTDYLVAIRYIEIFVLGDVATSALAEWREDTARKQQEAAKAKRAAELLAEHEESERATVERLAELEALGVSPDD